MKNKKKLMGVILTYMNQLVQIVVALVYTPFMLKTLGKSEYGLYQLVGSVVSYLSLLSLGFGGAYVRFYFKKKCNGTKKDVAELNGMFMTIFLVFSGVCLILGSVLIFNLQAVLGKGLTESEYKTADVLMKLMVLNMAITFPMSVYQSYITAQEEFIIQKSIILLSTICNPCLCIPLLLMGYGSVSLIAVALGINILCLIANWYVAKIKLKMEFSFHNFRFSDLKEMWVFTFFIFLNQIIDQVNWNVDKFLLGRYSGTAEVAVYGIAAQFNALYIAVSTAVSGVFVPQVNEIVADTDDNKALTNLFVKVGRVQFMMLLFVLEGFIIFGQKFVVLWAGAGYEKAYPIALILMLPVTVPLVQNIGIEIQRAKNKHKVRSVVYFFIAIVNVGISVLLVKSYGGIGAAIGTAFSLIAGNVLFMNWYYHCKLHINIILFWKKMYKFIIVIFVSGVEALIFRRYFNYNQLEQYFYAIIIFAISYIIMLYLFILSDVEREMIKQKIRRS